MNNEKDKHCHPMKSAANERFMGNVLPMIVFIGCDSYLF